MMRFWWLAVIIPFTLGFAVTPADAQYIAPNAAASAGGACTNGTYAWPDSSGFLLKCVSSVWTKVSQAGTADYNGTSCTSPNFIMGLDSNMMAVCAPPNIYTTLAGNTNNFQTAASKTYTTPVEGAMTPVQTSTLTQGSTTNVISRTGTVQNLQVATDVANAAGKKVTYQLIVSGGWGNKNITCYISGTSSCYNNVNTIPVNPGDTIAMQITTDNGGTLVRSSWSVELVYKGVSYNPQ